MALFPTPIELEVLYKERLTKAEDQLRKLITDELTKYGHYGKVEILIPDPRLSGLPDHLLSKETQLYADLLESGWKVISKTKIAFTLEKV